MCHILKHISQVLTTKVTAQNFWAFWKPEGKLSDQEQKCSTCGRVLFWRDKHLKFAQ